MNYRARLSLSFLTVLIVPVVALSLLVRFEMKKRLSGMYQRRVESFAGLIEDELVRESVAISTVLSSLTNDMVDDNRLRSALLGTGVGDRQYLLDYAGGAMNLAGFSMLQIQDSGGRILSSGHFRNEFDHVDRQLPRLLAAVPDGYSLVSVRAPARPFLALARIDSFEMGGRKFFITGGISVDERFLSRLRVDEEIEVDLRLPEEGLSADHDFETGSAESGESEPRGTFSALAGGSIIKTFDISYIDSRGAGAQAASFTISHGLGQLESILRSVDRWFLIVIAAAVLLSITMIGWMASRISRPLAELAAKTSRIDFDRMDIDFSADRNDEIGTLSGVIGEMVDRLRAGARSIRDAEHRATLGEMARQVNHDIKNGLTPIRNVFRHLAELSREAPEKLPGVFSERENTVDSSISYLEKLASNYARLYPSGESVRVDLSETVRRVVADRGGTPLVEVKLDLCEGAVLHADPLSMRRVVENLAGNAFGSLEGLEGKVFLRTRLAGGKVVLEVEDTGCGIPEEKLGSIFHDFYTTREEGTGLGLSIVRRLVMDLGGEIDVDSEVGRGSVFTVKLPMDTISDDRMEG